MQGSRMSGVWGRIGRPRRSLHLRRGPTHARYERSHLVHTQNHASAFVIHRLKPRGRLDVLDHAGYVRAVPECPWTPSS
jgi:hypothetical protein